MKKGVSMRNETATNRNTKLKIGKYNRSDLAFAFLFLLPMVLIFFIFKYYPLFDTMHISLTSWDFFSPKRIVGFTNYTRLFNSVTFRRVLLNTIHYTFWSTSLSVGIGLALALILTKHNGFYGRALKTMFFVPNITTASAVAILWIWIFNPVNGLMGLLYSLMGKTSPAWLLDPKYARWAIISLGVWRSMGYCMMIFTSSISQIGTEVYEAAAIDGASELRQATHITIPLIVPTLTFLVTTTFISAMQVFDVVQVMTGGSNGTNVANLYIYQQAFVSGRAGQAAAASMILFGILLVFTIVQRFVMREEV